MGIIKAITSAVGGSLADQWLEVIEPKVMGDQIGMSPLYTFLATIFGTVALGPLGFILGPMGVIIVNSFLKYRRMVQERGNDRMPPGNPRR